MRSGGDAALPQRKRRVFFYHRGHRGHGGCFFTTEGTEDTEGVFLPRRTWRTRRVFFLPRRTWRLSDGVVKNVLKKPNQVGDGSGKTEEPCQDIHRLPCPIWMAMMGRRSWFKNPRRRGATVIGSTWSRWRYIPKKRATEQKTGEVGEQARAKSHGISCHFDHTKVPRPAPAGVKCV